MAFTDHVDVDVSTIVVLVVDDDDLVRTTLSVLVSSLGYMCLVAEDGIEATEVLASTQCDLVITDIMMPRMNGLELLEYVKTNHRDVDVIVSTGHSEQATYADVIRAGALDYIKKPIDQGELEAKMARAVRERYYVKKLEELTVTDALTSILNRRAFDDIFRREMERANRQGREMFLAILDIDNFKQYNDQYGHLEGDKVLIALGQIMMDCTRNNVDFNFRLGGDEFAILLLEANADQATEIVQRILLRFLELHFGETTLSIGVVSCRRNNTVELKEDEIAIKRRADRAMYEAKESGKNTVICRT